jgi:hypothetical protein
LSIERLNKLCSSPFVCLLGMHNSRSSSTAASFFPNGIDRFPRQGVTTVIFKIIMRRPTFKPKRRLTLLLLDELVAINLFQEQKLAKPVSGEGTDQ